MNPNLTLIKKSLVSEAVIGDTVTYSIIARNDGDVVLNNVTIRDELVSDLKFVTGSIKINTTKDENQSIISGVNIGSLLIGESKILYFDTNVISKTKGNLILNNATADYTYVADLGKPERVGDASSNTNELLVKMTNLAVDKKADKEYASLNDIISYTVTLTNEGELDLINVVFTDTLPSIANLIDGSFTIDGVVVNSVNLNLGVTIGDIIQGQTITLKYNVSVVNGNCCGKLSNSASAVYSYILPNGSTGTRNSNTSTTSTVLAVSTFKQISLDEYLTIPEQKPDMGQINEITGSVEILKCHVIQTPKAISKEGQNLSGYKLVIHGTLKQVVQYTAKDTEAVHSAHYNSPFSTFIILSPDYSQGNKLEVTGFIENTSYNLVDARTFFKNSTILVLAKILTS